MTSLKNSDIQKQLLPNREHGFKTCRVVALGLKMTLLMALVLAVAHVEPLALAYTNQVDSPEAQKDYFPLKDSGDLHSLGSVLGLTPEATPIPQTADLSPEGDSEADLSAAVSADIEEGDMVAMIPPAALPVPDGENRQVRVPILMYHHISDPPRGSDEIMRDLSLPGPDFELQLRYLINEGYQSITMQDLIRYIQQGAPLPAKPVLLTFDDGYKDAFTVAFPLLKKYGFTGTFFIFTKPINEENREYLSWQEVELMSAAGMEIGSHSYSHPDLRKLSAAALQKEILGSKKDIEAYIQKPVLFFCYPSGAYDSRIVQAVSEAGYWGAVTTQQGAIHSSDNRLALQRVRVHGEAGLERFDALLNWEW